MNNTDRNNDKIELLHLRAGTRGVASDKLGMREMQARVYENRYEQYILLKAPPASGKSRALMYIALSKLYEDGLNQNGLNQSDKNGLNQNGENDSTTSGAGGQIRKVIVAVPEQTIAGSFRATKLAPFPYDWQADIDLCKIKSKDGHLDFDEEDRGEVKGKARTLIDFLHDGNNKILLCTHATLRTAYKVLLETTPNAAANFDGVFLAIDEFHHVSAEVDDNVLGAAFTDLMDNSSAHIMAMSGSFFRGDGVAVLAPEYEARFAVTTYSYYEQLSSYRYLKDLYLDYSFYTGAYVGSIDKAIDLTRKTIIYIPNVNSAASTKKKYHEVDKIIDAIGAVKDTSPEGSILRVKTAKGHELVVINLVEDELKARNEAKEYLYKIGSQPDPRAACDIIIALGMAKEGFDWPYCEDVVVVGYRGSLTEVVQIIGRTTRDMEGKQSAHYTNLIAAPAADMSDVNDAVNNMLKAISLSLLMEQVMTPKFSFRPKGSGPLGKGEIALKDIRELSPRAKKVKEKLGDKLAVDTIEKLKEDDACVGFAPEYINKIIIPSIVEEVLNEQGIKLDDEDKKTLSDHLVAEINVKHLIATGRLSDEDGLLENGENIGVNVGEDNAATGSDGGVESNFDSTASGAAAGAENDDAPKIRRSFFASESDEKDAQFGADTAFIASTRRYDVCDLDMELIRTISPFANAYSILSKNIDKKTLGNIKQCLASRRINISEEEAVRSVPRIERFIAASGRAPDAKSSDPIERRLGEVLVYMRNKKLEKLERGK